MKIKILLLDVMIFILNLFSHLNTQIRIFCGFHLVRVLICLVLPLVAEASWTSASADKRVTQIIDSLTLEQKIGQLFVFGFSGKDFNLQTAEKITRLHAGSLILFKRNIGHVNQIYKLNHDIQRLSQKTNKLPMILMIDQEGGMVSRIKTSPTSPSALSLGETNDLVLIEKVGSVSGKILKRLGFNLNLAPVTDLSNPKKVNFIGNRSFGNHPRSVYRKARAFALGLLKNGIIPTFKHFPGHGGITDDSHKLLPVKNLSLSRLEQRDALPFKLLARSKLPSAIMTAHINFPQIDPRGVPATFSKNLIQNTLINKYGYEGLIITDDLEMNGADGSLSPGQRAMKALLAGADQLMVAWTAKVQSRAYRFVLQKAREGSLSLDRVHSSLRKIIKYKLLYAQPPRSLNKLALKSDIKQLKTLSKKISHINFFKSITWNSKPFLNKKTRLFIYSSSHKFYNQFKQFRFKGAKYVPLKNGALPNFKFLREKNTLGIFYVTGSGTARILNSTPDLIKKRLIVVNATYPGIIKSPKRFLALSHINHKNFNSASWISSNLIGAASLWHSSNKADTPARSLAKKK